MSSRMSGVIIKQPVCIQPNKLWLGRGKTGSPLLPFGMWFTHAYKTAFDCRLVVTAPMSKTPINYWLLQISFIGIIFILTSDLVNFSPCQRPTQYQDNCFTVLAFVGGLKWLFVTLPTVTSHPFACGRQSSITFQLYHFNIFEGNLKSSPVREMCQLQNSNESLWWNAWIQLCCSASFSH